MDGHLYTWYSKTIALISLFRQPQRAIFHLSSCWCQTVLRLMLLLPLENLLFSFPRIMVPQLPSQLSDNLGFKDCVEYFLSKNANPLVRRVKTMDSSLILAVWNGHEAIVRLLLAAEPSVRPQSLRFLLFRQLLTLPMSDGAIPLHVASGVGNLGPFSF